VWREPTAYTIALKARNGTLVRRPPEGQAKREAGGAKARRQAP